MARRGLRSEPVEQPVTGWHHLAATKAIRIDSLAQADLRQRQEGEMTKVMQEPDHEKAQWDLWAVLACKAVVIAVLR